MTVPEGVDPRVRRALDDALDAGERGVQVAAYAGGQLVVDAWAGEAAPGTPVGEDTVFPILSAVKALTATAIHLQVERGRVHDDAPVSDYWPEFAARGKGAITVADILSHRAGVPQLPPRTTLARMTDWEWMTREIAAMPPALPPSCANAYHALSFGWLAGEIVRRTDPERRPFGRFLQEEICAPLGIESLWSGLPADAEERCATVTAASYPGPPATIAPLRRAAVPPSLGPPQEFQNDPSFRRACIPAGNGVSDARSLARLYAMLAGGGALDGVGLLSEERIRWCASPRPGFGAIDHVTGQVEPMGRGAFHLGRPPAPAVPDPIVAGGPRSLWHPGGGGTYAWADPDAAIAVAICHNRLTPAHAGTAGAARPPVFRALADAVRAVCAERFAQPAATSHIAR